ncbi:DUF58 domain-containing protein [Candidatus Accumulibacter sp. ACC003]|uniref:DUF58 domain-containing protein n=1 Tax=Candidatus Accumulibacter sp. ACC003 TaxID=2823334 RepID=UPI0025C47241|nr:DUF58 domain-containing protein [Candidatus Accumulibacter sp. ACC003]
MIIPDLAELAALRGAARGLSLHARRPALAQLRGGHRSAQRGRGLEFEEVRLYAPGDDARAIDWRVSARRGRLHTKLFGEERERPVWLVADLHAGLFFGSQRQLKSALLLRAAALLGWVAALGGDRVGAVIAKADAAAPRILPARAREAGVLPILEALVEAQPRAPGSPAGEGLRAALSTLCPLLKPGSLILLLSDFATLDATTNDLLAATSAHNDIRLLWIIDSLERDGLPAGNYRVGLPGRLWWLDGERCRRAWQDVWRARDEHLTNVCTRLHLPLNRLLTHADVLETLVPLLREAS